MKMPNAHRAVVDVTKLRDYCLSSAHPRGRHKARVFRSALGLGNQDVELLRAALLEAANSREAILVRQDEYGRRFFVDFVMEGPSGSAKVRSAWIVRKDENFPRLTTCYVQTKE